MSDLERQLAEVTAERDEAREVAEKAVNTANAIVNGRYLDQLLDAVEAFDEAHHDANRAGPVVLPQYGEQAKRTHDTRAALFALAAKIRKERS